MAKQVKDGGPAYPVERNLMSGMSPRDWFAGQALPGLISAYTFALKEEAVSHEIAKEAYSYADAMIADREITQ